MTRTTPSPLPEDLFEPRPLPEPLGVSGWLGFAPHLDKEQPDLVLELVEAIDALLRAYPIDAVYSAEPRHYRRTARGRRALAEALRAGRLEYLDWSTPGRGPGGPGRTGLTDATCILTLSSRLFRDATGEVKLRIQPAHQAAYPGLVGTVTAFLRTWFVRLRAASAFVSHYGVGPHGTTGDDPGTTRYERHHSARVGGWHAARRFVRGVFWGMGLGSDLCARLGGPAVALREAPVALREPLGEGVWLQVSREPPGTVEQLTTLGEYLRPLLGTILDVREAHAQGEAYWQAARHGEAQDQEALLAEAAGLALEAVLTPEPARRTVPIRGLRDLEVDVALNVHLAAPPSRAQLVHLLAAMGAWYTEGFEGGFGGAGFHGLDGPTVDGRVVRWRADLGSADGERAIRALARRLAALREVAVTQLVLGTSSVG